MMHSSTHSVRYLSNTLIPRVWSVTASLPFTLLCATDARNPKLTVFAGTAAALILASALGVLAGAFISPQVDPRLLSWLAGAGFVLIGV
jgi:putative Ca2+/H+ antiporter (TMEM165/GDT1 family)